MAKGMDAKKVKLTVTIIIIISELFLQHTIQDY